MTPTPITPKDPQAQLSSIKSPRWLSIVRRLQQFALSQQGLAVITVTILVNADGEPIQWTTPRMTCLEPMSCADVFLEAVGVDK